MGIDKAIFYVLVGKGFSFISQPITLYLIATYFTPQEQGFYYTFANILSLSMFLEMGLGVVLTQFASHEFAYLAWSAEGSLTGDEEALRRLLSILRKSVKWYGVLSFVFLAVLIPIGLIFFGTNPDSTKVNFVLPWVLLVSFSTLNLAIYPVFTVIEGCGKVAQLQQMRLYQALFGALSIWLIIISRGSLYTASILAVSNFIVSAAWLQINFRGLIRQISKQREATGLPQVSWREEILPMQWRIALSWMSGYFIYQLINPLLFKYQSSAVAGQMGMSQSISNIALGISIAWISTKFPTYGTLIQKKQYAELDSLALKGTLQALIFNLLLSAAVLICIYFVKKYFPHYGNRVLTLPALAALLFCNVINLLITSMAGYLRAHKAEPYLINSLIGAAGTSVIAWFCARYYSADILTYSIAAFNLILGLPLSAYIFLKKKQEWHAGDFKPSEV